MRITIIDFLKGYSIFTIVIFHLLDLFPLSGVLAKGISFGGAGVHVFVACSGFGLCLSQINKPLSYLKFLRKRFFKVYIPYILVVIVSSVIPYMYLYPDKWVAVLSHILLFKMFHEKYMNSFGYQLWFISMILQFYILFPLLFSLVQRHRWLSVIFALFISLSWAALVAFLGKPNLRVWNSFFLQYLWEFVLGMMIAFKYKEEPSFISIPKMRYLVFLSIVGLTVVGITGLKGGNLKLFNDVPSLVGYLSLALILYSLSLKMKMEWINKFFIFTNKFSYEWYLIHVAIFTSTIYLVKDSLPVMITAILALLLSYGSAIIYHHILNRIVYPRV